MASGEGSPPIPLPQSQPSHRQLNQSTSTQQENSSFEEDGPKDTSTPYLKGRNGRSSGRPGGHHWIPAQQMSNFNATSFWERKDNEKQQQQTNCNNNNNNKGGPSPGGRPQRSLFTNNSSNQRRQFQNTPPRSAFEGGRNENSSGSWEYSETSVSNSVSQSSFGSGQSHFSTRANPSHSRLSIIKEPTTSPQQLRMAFNGRGEPVDSTFLGALVTSQGFITVRLNQGVKVDITLNQAIRMQNNPASIIVALNADGCTSALIHPSGRVYQYGSRVEITTIDQSSSIKLAKMSHKGISFTGEAGGLVYLVDDAGTRSTSDVFSDMSGDFSMPVFRTGALMGQEYMDQCMAALHDSQYWVTDEGIENWSINGIRISQAQDGMVRVNRSSSKYHVRSSALNGTVNFTTPYVHCTASIGDACHLFVKRGERRLHYDGVSFIVRNAGHSAGYDEKNQFKVY